MENHGIRPYLPEDYHRDCGSDAMGKIPSPGLCRGVGFSVGCRMTMRSAHGNTLFSEIPAAASLLLTIFDICGAPFALAAMEEFWATNQYAKLANPRTLFNETTIPMLFELVVQEMPPIPR